MIIHQTDYSTNFQKYSEENLTDNRIFDEHYKISDNEPSFSKRFPISNSSDVDADGLPDSWEEEYGCIVGIDDSREDYDQDGLVNIDEYLLGCDPNNPDSDGDNYKDGFEAQKGTDPTNSADRPNNMIVVAIAFTTSLIIILIALGIGVISINRSKKA